jgi:hypothetical protein
MASSIKKIKKTFKQCLDIQQIKDLYEAMRAIDGHVDALYSKNKGWYLANKILDGHGIEYIYRGNNDRSPSITYVNTGDTYSPTVLIHGNRSTCYIGCWGDIVEKGSYESLV